MLDLFKNAIGHSDLRKLDLSGNPLGDDGIKVVAKGLSCSYKSRIQYVNFANCSFTLMGAFDLLTALKQSFTIEHAIIDKNNLEGHRHG